jgi:hypothetical protein
MRRALLALLVAIFAFALAGTAGAQVEDDTQTEEAEEPKKPEAATPTEPEGATEPGAEGGAEGEVDLPSDPIAYAKMLRDVLDKQKPKVLEKIEAKQAASQEKKMGRLSSILMWLSLGGVFLLFTPLFLQKRYPGKLGMLFKYSLLAAVTFGVTVLLFSSVMLLLRSVQGATASVTNPQISIAAATFDVLSEQAEDIAPLGPLLLEAPLTRVANGESDSLVEAILENVETLKADIVVFKQIAGWLGGISGIFGYVPTILTVITVLVFFLTMRPVLMKIIKLPAQAAEGSVSGASVVKEVMLTLGREILVTLIVIVALVVVTIFAGMTLTWIAKPAVEALLSYAIVCILYAVLLTKGFSTTWVYVSLIGSIAFLVLNVGIVLVSSGMFVGKAQKLLRLAFHEKVSLLSQWKFWLLGPIALAWVQLVPLIFIEVAQPAVENLIEWTMKGKELGDVSWPALLGSGPLILSLGFLVFWAFWGLKPLLFIAKYPAKAPAPAA